MTVDLSTFNVGDILFVEDSRRQSFAVEVVNFPNFDRSVKPKIVLVLQFSDANTVIFMADGSKYAPLADLWISNIISATKINKDNKTVNKIDLSNDIVKGSIITLSDGSTHVHRYTSGSRHNVRMVQFIDGLAAEVNNSGQSPYENGISIVGIEPPKPVIDLSTISIGDVCVTRNGYKIPWTNIIKRDTNADDPYMIVSSDGSYYCVTQKGYYSVVGHEENDEDIIEIRRASSEEKVNLAKTWTLG